MSIIQAIREKGSWLIIILVVLSLVGFILMDASVGRSGLFSGQSTAVGNINGHDITYMEYQSLYQKQQAQYERSSGAVTEQARLNIANQVWNQLKEHVLLKDISDRLNIQVTDDELANIFAGNIELDILKTIPSFVNPETRQFDKNVFRKFMQDFKQRAQQDQSARQSLVDFIEDIQWGAIQQRYVGMLSGVEYAPNWLHKYYRSTGGRNVIANVVSLPYYKVGIDKVIVDIAQIDAISDKYKGIYKPQEARAVKYIVIDGQATGADTAAILADLVALKPQLAVASNPSTLVSLTNAQIQYIEGYYTMEQSLSQLFPRHVDQIIKLQPSSVLGPFMATKNSPNDPRQYYNLARVLRKKKVPNEVDIRHILVLYNDQVRTEEEAKQRADSVVRLLQSGVAFDSLARVYSDDRSSIDKGGQYTFRYTSDYSSLDTAFRQVVFYTLPNTKRLVRTSYGYHYVEILGHKDVKQGYEVALASLAIQPSIETETQAANLASQFSIVAQSEGFDSTATLREMEISESIPTVFSDFSTMPRIGYSHTLVRWMFSNEKGAISAPIKVGDNYIVAQLSEIQTPDAYLTDKVKENVSDYFKQDYAVHSLPSYESLQRIADNHNVKIHKKLTISSSTSHISGKSVNWDEPVLVGYLTNPHRKPNKLLGPIQGKLAIYYAKIVEKEQTSADSAKIASQYNTTQRTNRSYIMRQSFSSYLDMMEEKDDRHLF